MKLGVNAWRLQTRTGVARVLLNIVRHWDREFVNGRFDEITLYSPTQLELDEPLPDFLRQKVIPPDSRMLVWENIHLPCVVRDDVLFCPSYTRPILTRSRTVSLMFEATSKLFPQYYPFSARFIQTPLHGWSARHSTRVITTTEQARTDIIAAYGAPPDRVRVVPIAPAEAFHAGHPPERLAEIRRKYCGGDFPYFLYVGKLTARRNVPRIIAALGELKKRQPVPHRLVIVGLNTTGIDLSALAEEAGVADDVKYYPFVADVDLALLYGGAEAFVLPYSYESVALTLFEAQASGIPVITADTIGLRQVAGDGAMFVPDVESSTLAAAMMHLINEPDLREKLVRKGLKNAQLYSWKRCSHEVLDILRESAS